MVLIRPAGFTNGKWRKYQSGDIVHGTGALIVTQASHGFTLGNALRHNGTTWVKAQANSDQTLADGVVVTVIDTNNFVIADRGFFNLPSHGLGNTGHYYFLSSATSGAFVSDQPSEFVQPLFRILDANNIHVMCDTGYLAATGNPGGSSSGGLALAGEHVLSSPATLLQVTGLDLDTQKYYKIAFNLNFAGTPGSTQVFVTYNDDTAQTGYFKERHNGSSTIGTSNDSLLENASLSTGNVRAGSGDLIPTVNSAGTSEYPGFLFTILGSSLGNMGVIYKDITANITKFSIRSNNMTFGIGSYLRVYK